MLNPTLSRWTDSRLDLMIAGTRDAVLMVEAGAQELTEERCSKRSSSATPGFRPRLDLQEQLIAVAAKPKREFELARPTRPESTGCARWLGDQLQEARLQPRQDHARGRDRRRARRGRLPHFTADAPEEEQAQPQSEVGKAFEAILKEEVRNAILDQGVRPDGRGPEDIRQITRRSRRAAPHARLRPVHPRPDPGADRLHAGHRRRRADARRPGHRGQEALHPPLQLPALTAPARSSAVRAAGRRDIGHGALAERCAAGRCCPADDEFPYVLRLVSEVLSSQRLVLDGQRLRQHPGADGRGRADQGARWPASPWAWSRTRTAAAQVLTDIQGIEDNLGDMDFKVAGTAEGITGLQMDIKTTGITYEIMQEGVRPGPRGPAASSSTR